ncbi:MAG: serine/threonine protein kinase [Deltaproteobacteria bacterium]|nr:serine/threonine protein kinase [Deltaproteobacteria bacterium]
MTGELDRTAQAPVAALDATLAPGTMVGAYRIERQVGSGGAGAVYAAEEPTIGKRVAIKVLQRGFAEDASAVARFEREARAANDVRHPGIVDVFAIGRLPDGRPYLVMSLLEGRSLRDELTERGKLPAAEAWTIAREIADALSAAHDAGVVHRDLKPENVFLERFGTRAPRPRVLDFGLAKVAEAPDGQEKLTQTGTPMGTPPYMAPEQWWGSGVDARTDQYAFGAVLFEMIAGRPPFVATKWVELVQKHLHEAPPTLGEAGAPVPSDVEALVARALAKASGDRFDSLRALVAAGDAAFGSPAAAGPAAGAAAPRVMPDELEGTRRPLAGALSGQRTALLRCAGIIASGVALLLAVGYAGPRAHDPLDWLHIAGSLPSSMIGLFFVVACVALARRARHRDRPAGRWALWLPALPAIAGGLGTYLGWGAILSRMPQWPRTERFALFGLGTFEASASRFVGFAVSSLLFLSIATLVGPVRAEAPGRKAAHLAAALGACALGAFALVADARSAALVATAAAAALVVLGISGRSELRSEIDRAVACLLAVGLAAAVSLARAEARMAVLWGAETTRAERAAEVVAASAERSATLVVAAFSLALVLVAAIARLRRTGAVSLRPAVAVIAVLGLAVAGDLVLHARFLEARERLLTELHDQFALFGRLDPPPGTGLDARRFAPSSAPALQVARDVVAINAEGVAPLGAMRSEAGALNLGRDLSHALARAGHPSRDLLSISIDRDVPWDTALRLLRVADEAGARRVELLLTRGARPEIPPSAPPEASWVLPGDFVAIRASLGPGGFRAPDARPSRSRFGEVAPLLIEQAKSGGELVLAIGD